MAERGRHLAWCSALQGRRRRRACHREHRREATINQPGSIPEWGNTSSHPDRRATRHDTPQPLRSAPHAYRSRMTSPAVLNSPMNQFGGSGSWQARHPPQYAAFTPAASPILPHSSRPHEFWRILLPEVVTSEARTECRNHTRLGYVNPATRLICPSGLVPRTGLVRTPATTRASLCTR